MRFAASAYGSTVEVRFAGEWRRGRLVELERGGEQWGVAFEDGGWAEDVRLGDVDVRYVFAGRGGGRGSVEDVGEGEGQELRKRGRTERGGGDRSSGGGATSTKESRKRTTRGTG